MRHTTDIHCTVDVAAGQKAPSNVNPHQSLNCEDTRYKWPNTIIEHRDELEIEITSKSGGVKKYKDPRTSRVSTRYYNGTTSSQHVLIKFDLEPPKHCTETEGSCESEHIMPCTWFPDATKVIIYQYIYR